MSVVGTRSEIIRLSRVLAALRQEGFPVALDLVGLSYPPALKRLNDAISP
jgi:UDP-N-acetylglucosamine 2-epimerase